MASVTTQWVLDLVDQISSPLHSAEEAADSLTTAMDQATESVDKLGKEGMNFSSRLETFGRGMTYLNQTAEAIQKIGKSFNDAVQPGIQFEYSTANMSAITSVVGEELNELTEKARNTSIAFGSSADKTMDLYAVLLSKLGPELVKVPEALDIMSQNALTLSKAMNNDLNGAVRALTTNLNQFDVSMDDPIRAAAIMTEQMNIMAAGAQAGASEVTEVAQALEQTGRIAKNAGVSFTEANAAIQILDKAGKKGAEGGVGLRNVLLSISAPTIHATKMLERAGIKMKEFQDKSKPLAERLKALEKILYNDALMVAIFGKENTASATALIQGIGTLEEYNKQLENTNTAHEQAAIIMDTTAEKIRKQDSWVNDLKVSLFEMVKEYVPFIHGLNGVMETISTLGITVFAVTQIMSIPWASAWTTMATVTRVSATAISTAIYNIPIIGWIALAISALIGLGVYFYNTSAKFRGFLWGCWEAIKTFTIAAYEAFNSLLKVIVTVLNPANWFSKGNEISSAFNDFITNVTTIGKRVGEAYSKGMEAGMKDFAESNPEKTDEKKKDPQVVSPELDLNRTDTKTQPYTGTGGNSGKEKSLGIGGSGGGGTRNITMNVTFTNYFNVSKGNVKEVANRVMQELTGVLTDANTIAG